MHGKDPDGSSIETQIDKFCTVDDNPFGNDFDPKDLITRLQNGENQSSIRKDEVIFIFLSNVWRIGSTV